MEEKDVAAAFRRRLNSHGHAFQQAVLKHIRGLRSEPYWTHLTFEAAEFPIELNGKQGHVDFILRFGNHYIVAECKRVDPAVGVWCFAATPFVRRWGHDLPVFSGPTVCEASPAIVDDMPHIIHAQRPVYHLGAELRTGAKGEGTASGEAINQAVTQVSRSAGGWIERLVQEKTKLLRTDPTLIVPAVFTTAQLFTTDADLCAADLHTGDISQLTVTPVTWLWFHTHLTRDLLPKLRPNPIKDDGTPSGLLLTRHTRTVAIVNVDGIGEFLASLRDEDFFMERI
jgi:hypothetical protein